ncbi:DUF1499 domain-containing protein [Reinekea blandensis]|uniref:DUF1499 domain-containing protein n=1 Tax=Reinekea blandensis MED297 TaxID=314283 RepID=A4BJ38_9GAMM|nr:DUF1499 domain-containing protein [Reinekea blandensis]EAR07883.1 hypothetical protein MED297_08686 [Reinekea sp. MED297] [Reinekea blandensis MED297]
MSTLLIIIAVLIVLAFAAIYWQNAQVPNLGVRDGKLAPLSSKPNNVSTQTDVAEKKVEPLPFKDTTENTMFAIKRAVEAYGGGEIKEETDTYLYVVFTTSLMKYHDDAEFWLDTDNQVVHFRSASRAGRSDLGLNRTRYETLTELYKQQ